MIRVVLEPFGPYLPGNHGLSCHEAQSLPICPYAQSLVLTQSAGNGLFEDDPAIFRASSKEELKERILKRFDEWNASPVIFLWSNFDLGLT